MQVHFGSLNSACISAVPFYICPSFLTIIKHLGPDYDFWQGLQVCNFTDLSTVNSDLHLLLSIDPGFWHLSYLWCCDKMGQVKG